VPEIDKKAPNQKGLALLTVLKTNSGFIIYDNPKHGNMHPVF
jgi:hypothetical protein